MTEDDVERLERFQDLLKALESGDMTLRRSQVDVTSQEIEKLKVDIRWLLSLKEWKS